MWLIAIKSLSISNLPNKTSMSEKSTTLFLWMASHDNTSFQKISVVLQKNGKCSRDRGYKMANLQS